MKDIRYILKVFLFGILFFTITTSTHAQIVKTGTGFALNNGYLVTNNHVIKGAQTIHVYGIRGDFTKKYIAEVVAKDEDIDLAILKISGNGFPGFGTVPYKIKTNTAEVAEDVWVLGFPMTNIMGEEVKFSVGVINSLTGAEGDKSTYQISAQVSHGSSGGPVFDDYGNLIGIVSSGLDAIVQQNVYYAIKTSYLKNLVETMYVSNVLPTNSLMGNYAKRQDKFKAVKNFVFYIECYDKKMPLDDVANQPSYIKASPTSLSFSEKQESKAITISTNAPSWKIASKPNWCTVANKTATSVTINATRNESYESRIGTIILETNDGKTVSLSITQDKREKTYLNIPEIIVVDLPQIEISIKTNSDSWKITSKPDWCIITNKTATSATLNATDNNSLNSRASIVVFETSDGIKKSAPIFQSGKTNEYNGYEYVDLGLPSGTLWASCNIGANKPFEYGKFFAWGETQTKNTFEANNYKYFNPRNNGWSNRITKYCNEYEYGYNGYTDKLIVLESTDDVAALSWGGNWKMPDKMDFEELVKFCTSYHIKYNGINGICFTGPSGNSIFLPFGGQRYNFETNIDGAYWSSSLCLGNDYYPLYREIGWTWNCQNAWSLELDYYDASLPNITGRNREDGKNIRPVFTPKKCQMQSNCSYFSASFSNIYVTEKETQKNVEVFTSSNSWKIISKPNWCNIISSTENTFTINIAKNNSYYRKGVVVLETTEGKKLSINIWQSGSVAKSGHEYVDLGLPSGTLWATCNLGAFVPEEYGGYYAWGETSTKRTYTKSNHYYTGKPSVLPPSSDAATANWGNDWQMPTKEQFEELIDNCTRTWTIWNGTNGWLLTGKNGNFIFLPITGEFEEDDQHFYENGGIGPCGFYHTSSRSNSDEKWYLCFDPSGVWIYSLKELHSGFPVRPVCK